MRSSRFLSTLLLAAYLPACLSYRQTGQSVAELTAAPKAVDQLRIITTTGARIEVWSPRLALDTLWGYASRPGEPQSVIFIPVSEIGGAQVLKTNPWRVGGVVLGAALGAALIVATVQMANDAAMCDSYLDC